MRLIVSAMIAFALTPAWALAEEAIATAPAQQPLPAAAPVSPLQDFDTAPDDGTSTRLGPCGPQTVSADGRADTKPHGYVEAGVGTRGYRHIAAGVCKPLANGGAIAVSVGQTEFQGRR
jgi:hypothetical protein